MSRRMIVNIVCSTCGSTRHTQCCARCKKPRDPHWTLSLFCSSLCRDEQAEDDELAASKRERELEDQEDGDGDSTD